LAENKQIHIEILNATGQLVKIVDQKNMLFGKQLLNADISNLKTGLHFIRLTSQSNIITKKFNILK